MAQFPVLLVLLFFSAAARAQAPGEPPLPLRVPTLRLPGPLPSALTLRTRASPLRCVFIQPGFPVPAPPDQLRLQLWLNVPPALR